MIKIFIVFTKSSKLIFISFLSQAKEGLPIHEL